MLISVYTRSALSLASLATYTSMDPRGLIDRTTHLNQPADRVAVAIFVIPLPVVNHIISMVAMSDLIFESKKTLHFSPEEAHFLQANGIFERRFLSFFYRVPFQFSWFFKASKLAII